MTAAADDVRHNLAAQRARLVASCRAAGRPDDAAALLAVSKTHPADAVRAAHAYLQGAIRAAAAGPALGRGKGPVHHLHPFYPWPAR